MARKKAEQEEVELIQEVEQEFEKETVLVFRAKHPLGEIEFKLLSDLLQSEQEKSGVKIVLAPYSSELVEEE